MAGGDKGTAGFAGEKGRDDPLVFLGIDAAGRVDEAAARGDEARGGVQKGKLLFLGLYLSCLFLGLRIGFGYKMKDRIEKGDFKLTHVLTMSDNSAKKVRVIGQNSLYVFFVTKEKRDISIIPISGNIKEIQHLIH